MTTIQHSNEQQQQQLLLLPVSIPSTAITIEHCPLTSSSSSSSSPYCDTTEAVLLHPQSSSTITLRVPKKVVLQYLSLFLLVSLIGMGIFASTAHTGPWAQIEEDAQSAQLTHKSAQVALPPCPCSSSASAGAPTIPAAAAVQAIQTTAAAAAAEVPKIPKKSPKKSKPKVQFHMRMFP